MKLNRRVLDVVMMMMTVTTSGIDAFIMMSTVVPQKSRSSSGVQRSGTYLSRTRINIWPHLVLSFFEEKKKHVLWVVFIRRCN